MAAGAVIKHKRKASAFTGGELAAGEFGLDTATGDIYVSSDGSTVTQYDVSAIGGGGGGGGMVPLLYGTVSNTISVTEDDCFDGYRSYILEIIAHTDVATVYPYLMLRSATPADITGTYKCAYSSENLTAGTTGGSYSNATAGFPLLHADGSAAHQMARYVFNIVPADASYKRITGTYCARMNSGHEVGGVYHGTVESTTVATGFKMVSANPAFTVDLTYYLWGITDPT